MFHYYDSFQLHYLIYNHPTLEKVNTNVSFRYAYILQSFEVEETLSVGYEKAKILPSDISEMDRKLIEVEKTSENLANVPHYSLQTPTACFDTFNQANVPVYSCSILIDVGLNRLTRSHANS